MRAHLRPCRRFLPALLALGLFASVLSIVACGGGDSSPPSSSASAAVTTATGAAGTSAGTVAPAAEEPLNVVRATLDALNRGDVDTAYANLSTDAQKSLNLTQVRLVVAGLKAANVDLSLTIESVGEATVANDAAEIEMTVMVKLGQTSIPVEDAASLVKDKGQWKIADHFLQTALAAVGLAQPPAAGERQLDAKGCAIGDPMLGVYAPVRLKVLDPCVTVTGVVRDDIQHAQDGDITFGLLLSGDDTRLVNDVNVQNYGGALHIEIVPMDQQRVQAPHPGDRITVTGPWVTDTVHGHNEIHPALRIEPAP